MKLQTLKKRKDFIKLNKFGKKYHSINFILQKYTNLYREEAGLKFGFTATKKLGNAVIRNRAKRRMRSLITSCLKNDKNFFKDNSSYVLVAKKPLIKASFINLKDEIKECLNKS